MDNLEKENTNMKIKPETNAADILTSHEEQLQRLELFIQCVLFLSALRSAVKSGRDLVEKIRDFSE